MPIPTLPPVPDGVPDVVRVWLKRVRDFLLAVAGGGAGIVFSTLDFTASNITSITTRLHNSLQGLQGGAAAEFYHLTSAQNTAIASDTTTTFSPTRTSWTDVGSPTVTGRYSRNKNLCLFEIKVVPSTSIATTAGTSYVALPVTAAGLAGEASMQNITTNIAVGLCVIDVANSRVYVPTQGASGNTFTIAGTYEV